MDKGLFFLIMSLTCFYFVLDEFVGKSRVSSIAGLMTPDLSFTGALKDKVSDAATGLDKVAPDVFYDPKNPEDKAKQDYFDKLKDKVQEGTGSKVY